MTSLLFMSVLFAALVIPFVAARDPRPRRGLRRMLVVLFLFNALYLAYIVLAHARYFVPSM